MSKRRLVKSLVKAAIAGVRASGSFSTYLSGTPWSESFMRQYAAALDDVKAQTNTIGAKRMLSLTTIAQRLHYGGRDRKRSVRRLFARLGVPMIRRGRGVYFVTDQQYAQLIEKMTCLPSGSAANISTSAVRSV